MAAQQLTGISKYHVERVPQPPTCGSFHQMLRWAVAVMDDEDEDYALAITLLACSLGELSTKQKSLAFEICDRVSNDFDAGALPFQSTEIS